MTRVTTVVQETAAVAQPCLFDPSDSDSDQEAEENRESENSAVALFFCMEQLA